MMKAHMRVVRGRESVAASPVCYTSEMHVQLFEEQLLDHTGLKCLAECERLI